MEGKVYANQDGSVFDLPRIGRNKHCHLGDTCLHGIYNHLLKLCCQKLLSVVILFDTIYFKVLIISIGS